MLQYLNQKRGQSTLEYAVLIVVIIGALLTIQVYIKRGVQGRLRSAADDIGDQYSDGNMNEIRTTNRFSNTEENFDAGNSSSTLLSPELTNETQNSVILNTTYEYWEAAHKKGVLIKGKPVMQTQYDGTFNELPLTLSLREGKGELKFWQYFTKGQRHART